MCLPNWVRWTAVLLGLCGSTTVAAGERLSVEQLAAQATSIAVVEVRLDHRDTRLELIQWLLQPDDPSVAPGAWTGPCLPDDALLRRWVEQHPRFESSMPLWAEALRARRYRAVVALRDTAAGLQPVCETESLLAEHWLAHPDHAGWRERLDRALSARTARPAGELTNRQRCSQDPGEPT